MLVVSVSLVLRCYGFRHLLRTTSHDSRRDSCTECHVPSEFAANLFAAAVREGMVAGCPSHLSPLRPVSRKQSLQLPPPLNPKSTLVNSNSLGPLPHSALANLQLVALRLAQQLSLQHSSLPCQHKHQQRSSLPCRAVLCLALHL